MAVNPNYPEPGTSSSVSAASQNPRYGEETLLEESETTEELEQAQSEPDGPEKGPETTEELEQAQSEEGPEKVDESLTHAELDRIAAERGVEFPPNLNKAEKIELLNSL